MDIYSEIINILRNGILLEKTDTIQKKMIELSKINDIEAMKVLYLLIRNQEIYEKTGEFFLKTSLDYQDSLDMSTICINLANNTVKQAYRLLNWIIISFDINPGLKDEKGRTMYGYLMANLIGIYKSNNNFHSRYDLEKVMVKLSKMICQMYGIDIYSDCYQNEKGKQKTYFELVKKYKKCNAYFLDSRYLQGEFLTMDEILEELQKKPLELLEFYEHTKIKNFINYDQDERFSKVKRYTQNTLEFVWKNL